MKLHSAWDPIIERRFSVIWIVWIAFFATPFIVFLIHTNISIIPNTQEIAHNDIFKNSIFILSVILLIIAPLMKKFFLNFFVGGLQQSDPISIIQAYLKTEIIAITLPESISFIAIISYVMGVDKLFFLLLLGLSAGGMILVRPSLQELTDKIPPELIQE